MKTKIIIVASVILLLMFLLAGCEIKTNNVISKTPVGVIVDMEVIPTSFNESIKTLIKTSTSAYVVYGTMSVQFGEPALVNTHENGAKYLCVESQKYCNRIK